ncbi:MAG: hypothetical protein H0X35_01340 [Pseudonocardiales bacterium]|nr:hypothetical protein [Pseudonocardiales bacterium]
MRTPLLVGVLAAAAVAVAGCSGQPTTGAPAPTTAPSAAGHKPAAADKGVRGQITAETGSTWTVTNAKGKAFTVTVNPQTMFGTAAAPGAAAQFPVGTTVRVAGSRTGTTVTATRITPAKSAGATPSAAPTPQATPTDLLNT